MPGGMEYELKRRGVAIGPAKHFTASDMSTRSWLKYLAIIAALRKSVGSSFA